MKQFLIKSFILSLLVLFSAGYILHLNPIMKKDPKNDYMKALIDKHDRLNKIKSPRLILVGGSNLSFGVNSKMLEDSLKLPVANMGLHAGLGVPFIINDIKPDVRMGDILLVSIEYYLAEPDLDLIDHMAAIYPADKSKIEKNYYSFKDRLSTHVKQIQKTFINGERPSSGKNDASGFQYTRKVFSQYGDVVDHLQRPSVIPLRDIVKFEHLDYTKYIDIINELARIAKSKGASIYYVFPAYPAGHFKENESAIIFLKEQMAQKLEIEIISTPQDFIFPDNYFFDTVYHLNAKGREVRSKKLISLLKFKI